MMSKQNAAAYATSSIVRGSQLTFTPVKEGFLVKQAVRGHGFAERFVVSTLGFRRWHTHYIKVFPEKLQYFQMQDDERPTTTIKLESLTTSVRISQRRPNCLVVDFMSEEWGPCALYMQAHSEKSRDEWVEAIRTCIPKVSKFTHNSSASSRGHPGRTKSERFESEPEFISSTVVLQLSKLHDKLLALAEDKRLANSTLDSKETEFSQLKEENDVLKDELSAWWNWTNSQKQDFAHEQAQVDKVELEFQRQISHLVLENARLREEADSKIALAQEKKRAASNSKSPKHQNRANRLEPIIERDSEIVGRGDSIVSIPRPNESWGDRTSSDIPRSSENDGDGAVSARLDSL